MQLRHSSSLIFLVALIMLACGATYGIQTFFPYPCEDAYITYRFARNLSVGLGPVFNPGERVEGYSNFLWMAAIAVARSLGLSMADFSRGVAALCSLGTMLLVWYIPRRHFNCKGPATGLGPVLYLLFLPFHFYTTSGLETSLYLFLIVLSVHMLAEADERPAPCLAASCILLLLALTRPEGIIFFCAWSGALALRHMRNRGSMRPCLPGMCLFIVLYGAFLLWRMTYYGMPLPNTYYAKGSFALPIRVALGWAVNTGFMGHYYYLVLLPAALAGFAGLPRSKPFVTLLIFLAGTLAFSIGFAGWDWMPFFRYSLPAVPLLIIIIQILFSRLWQTLATRGARRPKVVWAVLTTLFIAMAAEKFLADLSLTVRLRSLDVHAFYNQKAVGDWIKEAPGPKPVIAIGDIGRLVYFADVPAVDLYGLASREFALLKQEHGQPELGLSPGAFNFDRYKDKERGLLLARAPDYVFLYNFRLKISNTFPGSKAGLAGHPDFDHRYAYMCTLKLIPEFTSPLWPKSLHFIDILDLSSGFLSWMHNGWGYDIYVRRDSPCRRFRCEFGPDEKVQKIILVE